MPFRLPAIFCFLALTGLLFLPASAADVDFPVIQSMASFPFDEEAGILRSGEVTATFSLSHANHFMFDTRSGVTNDMESLNGVLGLRVGMGRRLTLELYCRWSSIMGGWLDGLIENFHSTFSLPDNHRPTYPRDQVEYRLDPVFAYNRSLGVAGPVTLALHLGVMERKNFSLNARLALQAAPAGEPGLASARPALIAGMSVLWKRNAFSMGLSGHLAFFRSPQWLEGVSTTPRVFLGEGWARIGWFKAGILWRTSPFRTGDLAHNGWQVVLGFRLRRGVEFRIQEDLGPFDTTPDIQFGIRIHLEALAKSSGSR